MEHDWHDFVVGDTQVRGVVPQSMRRHPRSMVLFFILLSILVLCGIGSGVLYVVHKVKTKQFKREQKMRREQRDFTKEPWGAGESAHSRMYTVFSVDAKQMASSVQRKRGRATGAVHENTTISTASAREGEFLGQDVTGIELLEEAIPYTSQGDEKSSWRVARSAYVLSFNTKRGLANWVAYELTQAELEKVVPRYSGYREDRELKPFCLSSDSYRGSGYSRGHLAPSADMRFDSQAQEEAAYLGNLAPQSADFNNGIWNTLENRIRKWADRYGSIYVVTGPAYIEETGEYLDDWVSVPSHYFKALLVYVKNQWEGIGFLIPQHNFTSSIWAYAITLDSLQRVTGWDFFPLLPDSIEVKMENTITARVWQMPQK